MKTFGFYSQYMDCPNSLKLHKTVVCTDDEAWELLEDMEFDRMAKPTDFGRFVIFMEEIK